MKDHDISLLNYYFNYFFQHCIQEYQIQVISHHFSNHKIEGLTVIDEFEKQELMTEFDKNVWPSMVDYLTVHYDRKVEFTFLSD